jgi:hypothetical protein
MPRKWSISYQHNDHFCQALNREVILMHSTGNTGPKIMTARQICWWVSLMYLLPVGRDLSRWKWETKFNYIVTWLHDYRRVLDWRSNLLDSLIQRVTTHYNSLLQTHQCPQSIIYCRCLLEAFNDGVSPDCPRSQLPASHSSNSQQLNRRSPLTNSIAHQPTNSLTPNLVCL